MSKLLAFLSIAILALSVAGCGIGDEEEAPPKGSGKVGAYRFSADKANGVAQDASDKIKAGERDLNGK